jgi:hypothetical protein
MGWDGMGVWVYIDTVGLMDGWMDGCDELMLYGGSAVYKEQGDLSYRSDGT